jgi:hypothetical protein
MRRRTRSASYESSGKRYRLRAFDRYTGALPSRLTYAFIWLNGHSVHVTPGFMVRTRSLRTRSLLPLAGTSTLATSIIAGGAS